MIGFSRLKLVFYIAALWVVFDVLLDELLGEGEWSGEHSHTEGWDHEEEMLLGGCPVADWYSKLLCLSALAGILVVAVAEPVMCQAKRWRKKLMPRITKAQEGTQTVAIVPMAVGKITQTLPVFRPKLDQRCTQTEDLATGDQPTQCATCKLNSMLIAPKPGHTPEHALGQDQKQTPGWTLKQAPRQDRKQTLRQDRRWAHEQAFKQPLPQPKPLKQSPPPNNQVPQATKSKTTSTQTSDAPVDLFSTPAVRPKDTSVSHGSSTQVQREIISVASPKEQGECGNCLCGRMLPKSPPADGLGLHQLAQWTHEASPVLYTTDVNPAITAAAANAEAKATAKEKDAAAAKQSSKEQLRVSKPTPSRARNLTRRKPEPPSTKTEPAKMTKMMRVKLLSKEPMEARSAPTLDNTETDEARTDERAEKEAREVAMMVEVAETSAVAAVADMITDEVLSVTTSDVMIEPEPIVIRAHTWRPSPPTPPPSNSLVEDLAKTAVKTLAFTTLEMGFQAATAYCSLSDMVIFDRSYNP